MGTRAAVGCVIEADALRWTALRARGARIESAGDGRLPIESAAGGEADAAWGEALAGLPADRALPVALALPARDALLRVLELPAGDTAELASMVALQVDKLSPFPAEQLVVGWEALDEATPPRRVLAAAVRRPQAEAAAQAVEAARRRPGGLDLDLLAWWRLLRDTDACGSDGRELHLRVGAEEAWVLVCDDGAPVLFLVAAGPFEDGADLREELRGALAALDLERGPAPLVRRVLWPSGDAEGERLAEAALDGEPVPERPAPDALPPLSLGVARRALDPPRGRMDLTPPEQVAQRRNRAGTRRVLAAAAALLVVWIGGVAAAWGLLEWRGREVDRLEREVAELEAPADEARELLERVRSLEDYADRSRSALEAFREVAVHLPEGLTLTSLSYRKGRGVTLRGQAPRPDAIYEYVSRLETSPMFAAVQPEGITSRTTPAGPVSEFRLATTLTGSAAP